MEGRGGMEEEGGRGQGREGGAYHMSYDISLKELTCLAIAFLFV